MKKLLTLILVLLFSFSVAVGDAAAKRFGGARSFGKQRESVSQQAAPRAPAQAPAAAPAKPGNRWLGPLAGLAAGGLLASLLMGHGFEGIKMMDILLLLGIAAAVFFVFRNLRRGAPQPAPAAGNLQYAGFDNRGMEQAGNSGGGSSALAASSRPAWFEDEPFLRQAKANFIRLQDANDKGDLNDIREFTMPEVFAEISLQIQERGGKPQHTEVVVLNADMVEVVTEADYVVASVRFSGLIREELGAAPESFNEIWHIQKSLSQPNASWFIAGIQQVN